MAPDFSFKRPLRWSLKSNVGLMSTPSENENWIIEAGDAVVEEKARVEMPAILRQRVTSMKVSSRRPQSPRKLLA